MSRRFTYRPMTTGEFADALAALGMEYKAFARIAGLKADSLREMMKGDRPFPQWIPVMLELLKIPKALGTARQAAAERITEDRRAGEKYPFIEN